MRLALISHGPPDDFRHFSGIPWHILQELRRAGHEVEPFYAEPAKWAREMAQFKNLLSLKFSRQPHHVEADPWILRTRSMKVDKYIRAFQPQAILCAGFPETAATISASFPLYIWMDALFPTVRRSYRYFQNYYSKSDARALGRMEKCVLARSKKIWLSSEWAANEARADFPDSAARIAVQSFGANLAEPPSSACVEQSIASRNLVQPTFLFLANEWERKGGDTAVATVRQLHKLGCPAKLVIIGLSEKPSSLPSEPWLEWVGRLDKNQAPDALRLNKYLSEAAFLLLPSTADCTPIVCHEAAAFGLPVLATNVGGLPSTVDSGQSGQLWKVEKFAEEAPAWILAIFADRPRYTTMARAARHRFETTGNWFVNVRAITQAIAAGLN